MRVHRRTAVCLALDLLLILVLVRTGPGAAVAHDALLDPGRWFVQVSPDAAVVTVLGVLCWFALLWIAVGLLLVSVATTPGAAGRLADALATQVVPTALRRAATLALGLSVGTAAVAGTVAGPAMAGAALAGTAGAGTSGADTAVTGPAVTKLARVTSARAAATVPTRHAATDHRPQPAGSAPPGVDWPLEAAPAGTAPVASRHAATPSSASPPGSGGSAASRGAAPSSHPPGFSGGRTRPGAAPGEPRSSKSAAQEIPTRQGRPIATTDQAAGSAPVRLPGDGTAEADSVVVRLGDCLWLIAARRLGPQAGSAEIAHEWPRWYATNRRVIGDNPSVILPGQALAAPSDRDSDRPVRPARRGAH